MSPSPAKNVKNSSQLHSIEEIASAIIERKKKNQDEASSAISKNGDDSIRNNNENKKNKNDHDNDQIVVAEKLNIENQGLKLLDLADFFHDDKLSDQLSRILGPNRTNFGVIGDDYFLVLYIFICARLDFFVIIHQYFICFSILMVNDD